MIVTRFEADQLINKWDDFCLRLPLDTEERRELHILCELARLAQENCAPAQVSVYGTPISRPAFQIDV
jgi:hypothetical protein